MINLWALHCLRFWIWERHWVKDDVYLNLICPDMRNESNKKNFFVLSNNYTCTVTCFFSYADTTTMVLLSLQCCMQLPRALIEEWRGLRIARTHLANSTVNRLSWCMILSATIESILHSVTIQCSLLHECRGKNWPAVCCHLRPRYIPQFLFFIFFPTYWVHTLVHWEF